MNDDNNYVSSNEGDNLKYKLLKEIFDNETKDDKHNVNVLSLKILFKEEIEKQ